MNILSYSKESSATGRECQETCTRHYIHPLPEKGEEEQEEKGLINAFHKILNVNVNLLRLKTKQQ